VIYNAGVDPYEGCDIGGLSGMTAGMLAERDQIGPVQKVFSDARPVLFQVVRNTVDAHAVDARTTFIALHPL
jgi:hypothetical protein